MEETKSYQTIPDPFHKAVWAFQEAFFIPGNSFPL